MTRKLVLVVQVLCCAPAFKRIQIDELLCLVDLCLLTRYHVVCVLQKVKVGRETDICMASFTQIAVVCAPFSGVFQFVSNHRRIYSFDTASAWHHE